MSTEDSDRRQRRLADAVANAVLQGASVESQAADQAIVVHRVSNNARFLFCLLFWLPGFMFGHHKTSTRQMIRVDEAGVVQIDAIGDGAGSGIPANRRTLLIAGVLAAIVFVIFVGVCAAALEDATDISCRSTLRCDDSGNCTYVTECD